MRLRQLYEAPARKVLAVMPGGFHPFHAGHMALYNSARKAFPDSPVYVAASDSTKIRPFPFAIKEKLAGNSLYADELQSRLRASPFLRITPL